MHLIQNLQFRRATKAASEITCNIPDIQREEGAAHTAAIYDFQKQYYAVHGDYLISGTISIVVVGQCEYLVDGQHRMAAYKRLINEWPDRALFVSIDYYYCTNNNDIETIYKYVNTCRPNAITSLTIENYKIIKEAAAYLRTTFKSCISKSERPRPPNISVESIEKYIETNNIIARGNITSGANLIERIRQYNAYLSTISVAQFRAWGVENIDTLLRKVREKSPNLYIGIYRNFEWLERIANNRPFDELQHYSSTFRAKITSELRMAVWNSEFVNGKCYCCNTNITIKSFECGHVVPIATGGQTIAANLRPICRQCNMDMATMNLEEYRRLINAQMNNAKDINL